MKRRVLALLLCLSLTGVSALAADRGAWGVRVHDVRGSLDAVAVTAAWRSGGGPVG